MDGDSLWMGRLFEIQALPGVNERWGAAAGTLLKQIAARSSRCSERQLARVAGDTFAVVLSGVRDAAKCHRGRATAGVLFSGPLPSMATSTRGHRTL